MVTNKPYNQEAKTEGSSRTAKIKLLVQDLRNKDGIKRVEARHSLAFIGKAAVPHLIPLMKESDADVRWEATKTLAEIGDAGAAPDLVIGLDDPNFGVRWLAAEGLIASGREALRPLLRALIDHPESGFLRMGAHHVLHELSKKGYKDLLQPVVAALDGTDPVAKVLESAYNVLEKL